MNDLLNNPVFNALSSGDKDLSFGTKDAKFFDEEVSPFAGFEENNKTGFDQLRDLLPTGRRILYATTGLLTEPAGWQLQHEIKGLQFIYQGDKIISEFHNVKALKGDNVEEMIALVKLTNPGPFGKRTIDFGSYFGIFEDGKLAAMTGQRLHVKNYTEISAVCTHPEHLGKGYASTLLQHQLQIILENDQIPFLHVRSDNDRAIAVYERLGFVVSREMNFYLLKRE